MKICLWRLGSLEHKIYPTTAAVERFKRVLANALEEENSHLVWGPDVDVKVIDVNDFDSEVFDLQAILKDNQLHIVESVKEKF